MSTYSVQILNYFNPELQLKDTQSAIKNKLLYLLSKLRGFKFVKTLALGFKKIENDDETKFTNIYSKPKAETIIIKSDIGEIFESMYTTIISPTLTHWSSLFGKLLLMNDFHSSLLAIKVLSSSIYSPVYSMSWSIYVFCGLPLLFFPFAGIQKSKLYAISSSCLHMRPENFNRP